MTKIIKFEPRLRPRPRPRPSSGDFFEDNKVLIDNIYNGIEAKMKDPNTDDITRLEAKLLYSILVEDDSTFDKTAEILRKVQERGIKVIN